MPRPKSIVPAYRFHASTGQACVTLTSPAGSRKTIYLGQFGTDASVAAYGSALAEWKGGSKRLRTGDGISVAELLLRFHDYARHHYGERSRELKAFKYALKPVREMFGPIGVSAFGPKALRAIRDRYVELNWCRRVINRQLSRVRQVFRWAVGEELAPPSVIQALECVGGLDRGRGMVKESKGVRPVDWREVEKTMPYMTPTVQSLVRFHRWTGCRPNEAVQVTLADLDRSGPCWWFRPRSHKGLWRNRDRVIAVGPRAQQAILDVLSADRAIDVNAALFSPRQSEQERAEERRKSRKTRIQPSQQLRAEQSRQRAKRRPAGEEYTTGSYNAAIRYAIRKARKDGVAVEHWHVGQLRHLRGTEIRETHGIETVAGCLGHAALSVSEIYAEKNMQAARDAALATG